MIVCRLRILRRSTAASLSGGRKLVEGEPVEFGLDPISRNFMRCVASWAPNRESGRPRLPDMPTARGEEVEQDGGAFDQDPFGRTTRPPFGVANVSSSHPSIHR